MAFVQIKYLIKGTADVQAEGETVIFCGVGGIFHFVAVVKNILRADDRIDFDFRERTDPLETVVDLFLFVG